MKPSSRAVVLSAAVIPTGIAVILFFGTRSHTGRVARTGALGSPSVSPGTRRTPSPIIGQGTPLTPVPAIRTATAQYLSGPGAPLQSFRAVAAALLRGIPGSSPLAARRPTCQSASSSPDQLSTEVDFRLVAGVPDPALQESEIDEHQLVEVALRACAEGDVPTMDSALHYLATTDTLLQQRLKEVGL
jgi:hypothetical protein